jgi:cytoskeletal protein RodZ
VSDYAEFGRFLSQQRELRGLSRDDVARSTKIPATLVAALEDGQTDRLPERVFLQNLIRAYAQVIGLSADDAINRWHEIPGVAKEPETLPVVLEQRRKSRAWKTLLLVTVAAAVGAYVFFVVMGQLPPPWGR